MAVKTIQYPYAYDENNNRVFIEDVNKSTRGEHQYYCPDCGGKMEPRQGDNNTWHFAHDHHKCSRELYLHKMAKQILCDRFNNPSIPFRIRMIVTRPCGQSTSCKLEKAQSCLNWQCHKEYELTQYYKGTAREEATLKEEATGKTYRSDVLLCGNGNTRKDILLEVYYKHKTEAEKISIGERIIEFRLKGMEDLRRLETTELFEEGKNVSFTNFPSLPISPEQIEKEIRENSQSSNHSRVYQEELPTCRQSVEYRRQHSRWQRMTYLRNGEQSFNGVFENELEIHNPKASVEITFDYDKINDLSIIYVLAASRIPSFKHCGFCDHCVNTDTVQFCDMGKNGTSRKGTFDFQKGVFCRFFKWDTWDKLHLNMIQKDYVEGVDYQVWINNTEK